MFQHFFAELRAAKAPVSLREYLTLIEAMEKGVISAKVEDFYYLSRATLIKDERHLDAFDQVFAKVFQGAAGAKLEDLTTAIPEEWLRKLTEKFLTDEEKAQIEALGGWEKLMQTLAQRVAEQKERHEGGDKWIGTGGTSPFGANGYNPEGVRIGQDKGRHNRAVKVWDKREFKNLDDQVELGTRNIKVALRRLRRWARDGAHEELDLDNTIRATAEHGYLDVKVRPERRNSVRVLLFLDIGGTMDPHIKICEELFSAARSEFKRLEHFYFHNCLYESVWTDNRRRASERRPTLDVLHSYPRDYKVVFVGDAYMSPYEISHPGGSVEHMNPEAGAVWLQRAVDAFPNLVWLNPDTEDRWGYAASIKMVREIIGPDRMFPLTLDGVERAMRRLGR